MGVRERLIEFAESKGMNVHRFEVSCGMKSRVICNMRNGATTNTLEKIAEKYPDLDLYYIITGRHRPQDTSAPMPLTTEDKSEWYLQQIAIKDKQIEFLMKMLEECKGKDLSQSISL